MIFSLAQVRTCTDQFASLVNMVLHMLCGSIDIRIPVYVPCNARMKLRASMMKLL